jgi:predicted phosphoadenosine phosphosulfate sulfurtransferase
VLIKVEVSESFEVEISSYLPAKRTATRFPHRRHLRRYSNMRSEDKFGGGERVRTHLASCELQPENPDDSGAKCEALLSTFHLPSYRRISIAIIVEIDKFCSALTREQFNSAIQEKAQRTSTQKDRRRLF